MITVSIFINGNPIFTRSARNLGETWYSSIDGEEIVDHDHASFRGMHLYKLDDGTEIKHLREDGAVKLAIEMLKTIKEP